MIKLKREDSVIVDIGRIDEWADNSRQQGDGDIERVEQQIARLGQYKPLLVVEKENGRYEVIGGNARLKALKNLGIEKVWVMKLSPENEQEKIKIAISDNDRIGYYIPADVVNLVCPLDGIAIELYDLDFDSAGVYVDNLMDNNVVIDMDDEGFIPEVPEAADVNLQDYIVFTGAIAEIAAVKAEYGLSKAGKIFDIQFLINKIGG